MNTEFLVIAAESAWAAAVSRSLAPYGRSQRHDLETSLHLLREHFVMVVIDESAVADLQTVITRVIREAPETRIVVASDHDDWRHAREVLLAGAADYVARTSDPDYLHARWAQNLKAPATDATSDGLDDTPARLEDTEMVTVNAKLLFVDNNPDFLQERVTALRAEGYHVVPASSEKAARAILEREHVDLAIIDIRLHREEDPEDKSGIQLAMSACQHIPSIMLTSYPTTALAVEALRSSLDGQSAVMDLISRRDGPQVMLDAVERQLRKRVFIVHGRDAGTKQTVARFVESLKLKVIILSEQLDTGRAIIQKFEDHSNVRYAIVLLTPDDLGGLRKADGTPEALKARARQNVVFELGYFVGKLGRDHVAVLHTEEVEVPSDYEGVAYIPMAAGDGWKLVLAQNMRQAGLEFELKRVVAG